MKALTNAPGEDFAVLSARVGALEEVIVELMVLLARSDRALDSAITKRLKAVAAELRDTASEPDATPQEWRDAAAFNFIAQQYIRNAPS